MIRSHPNALRVSSKRRSVAAGVPGLNHHFVRDGLPLADLALPTIDPTAFAKRGLLRLDEGPVGGCWSC